MKILIATDGSDFSKAAIEKCCKMLDEPEDTAIKIVSAFERSVPMPSEPFAISAGYYLEVEKAAQQQAEECVAQAAAMIRECVSKSNLDLTTRVKMGAPARVIVEEAEEWGADLILIGSHGYGFWSRLMLGSVSNSVVHNAPCSVLIVRKTSK